MVGGRLGYILFYQFGDIVSYLKDPVELLAVWRGGMSFHGGLLGCIVAGWLFSRYTRIPFRVIADSVVVAAPVGLGMGRLGNFINGELYGRPTTVPWGMIFPEGGNVPRHPSQLYEALLEGFILFAILWTVRKRGLRDGMMVALFVILYGFFRFIVEFFREPDAHLGFVLGGLSMGQVLCLIMIAAGGLLAAVLPPNPPEQKPPPEEKPPDEKDRPGEKDRPDDKDRPRQEDAEPPSE
jgi:phosphatidylglycerol:prolipoprotein diacylglycerol transferase